MSATATRIAISYPLTTKEVAAETGATFRQLDKWWRGGLIPGATPALGSGASRRWDREQVDAARTLVESCPTCRGTGRRS